MSLPIAAAGVAHDHPDEQHREMVETLAQKRFFIGSLPCMAEENKREIDMLTLNAADMMPIEMPWQGTPRSPGILLETRQRKLIPFSPFDSSLSEGSSSSGSQPDC